MADPTTELRAYFEEYVARFNEALAGPPRPALLEAIAAQYTSTFMAAGPQGVSAGENDAAFLDVLEQGFQQYVAIGTKRMIVLDVHVTPVDARHAMARVDYRASYVRPSDGEAFDLDFDVTYVLQRQERWQVFAFIAGDEEALYREHGLLPDDGTSPD